MTNRTRDPKGRFVASLDRMEDDEPVVVATSSTANNTTRTAIQETKEMLCPALATIGENLTKKVIALTTELLKAESRIQNLRSHLTEGTHPKYYTWKADPMWSAQYKTNDIVYKIAQLKHDSYKKLIEIDIEVGEKTVIGIKEYIAEIKQQFLDETDLIASQLRDNGVSDYESQVCHDREVFKLTLEACENKARTKFTHERILRDNRRNQAREQRAEQNIEQALQADADSNFLKRLERLEANSKKQDADKRRLITENKKLSAELLKLKSKGNEKGKSKNQKLDGANITDTPTPSSEQPKKRRRPKSSRKGNGSGKAQENQVGKQGSGNGNQN